MKKKFLTILLTIALAMGLLSALAITACAETVAPEMDIAYCNISFRDSVCIKYAVKSNVSNVKILIWSSPEAEYTVGTHDDEITAYYSEDIGGVSHLVFDYTQLSAKQMTDVVYARAYTQVDGVDYYSEVNKYSILQYAYNKLGKTATASTNAELKEMLTNMLSYGASAQKYFDYQEDRLATADWYQVKLTGGVLDDGCTYGLYLPGDKVTITAPETASNGDAFSHWEDGQGNQVATTATYELTVGTVNEAYTPVYTHTVVIDAAVAPTCNATGLTEGSHCSVCGEVIVAQEVIEATGEHTFGEWVTVKEATTAEEGLMERSCDCGAKETKIIEKLSKLAYELNYWGDSYSVTGIGTWTDSAVVIPATYKGLPVTDIDWRAFKDNKTISSITIPASVEMIMYEAFGNCSNLTSVTFEGTIAQWNAVWKHYTWENGAGLFTIYCTNGEITYLSRMKDLIAECKSSCPEIEMAHTDLKLLISRHSLGCNDSACSLQEWEMECETIDYVYDAFKDSIARCEPEICRLENAEKVDVQKVYELRADIASCREAVEYFLPEIARISSEVEGLTHHLEGVSTGCKTTGEHMFGEWITAKEATATEEGLKLRTCVCGAVETQTIAENTDITKEDYDILYGNLIDLTSMAYEAGLGETDEYHQANEVKMELAAILDDLTHLTGYVCENNNPCDDWDALCAGCQRLVSSMYDLPYLDAYNSLKALMEQ